MAKFKFIEWLILWLQETPRFEFDWDEGNSSKSAAKHSVTTAETEEVFGLGQAAALGVQMSPEVPEERLGIVGATMSGRILHVVFTLRAGKVRPISSRPAKKDEREYYEAYLREISD
ncbi:MAG: BrnT family toxin [Elusimicrobia bacterium]|nr:BrnT family toxin [Elusimicrobiota bacterium]